MFKARNEAWKRRRQSTSCLDGANEQQPSTSGVQEDSTHTSAREYRPSDARQLRQRPIQSTDLKAESTMSCSGMRLVDSSKMSEAFNEAFRSHQEANGDCQQPHLAVVSETKVGMCWKMSLGCTNCNFKMPPQKLYQEVQSPKRGPNPAAPNVGLAVGLQDTPLGNTRARYLLASMDVPPPSRSCMQKKSNLCGEAVKQLNDRDMSQKLQQVKETHGNTDGSVNIAMDGRYNSTVISSRKKMGQNASQAIGIACETMTDNQYIIAAAVQNKLCWTAAWMRGRGLQVQCPGGHADCTANLHRQAPLSEYELGKTVGKQLGVQGAFVRYVTTDGDARSASGIEDAIKLLEPMWTVERQADPTHLGQAQFRQCYSAKFSAGMFPAKTRERQQEQQKILSQDIKCRCSLVLKELLKATAGDLSSMRRALPHVVRAMVKCYDGDCSSCRRYSYVCSGGVTTSWWQRSMFLASHRLTHLNLQESDKFLLQEIIKMKLSVSTIEELKLGTSTQKCEAVNRAISVSLPKNVNYSRNVHGRLASTVHRLNNGLAESASEKLKCVGVQLSPRTKSALKSMERAENYHKEYSVKEETVKRKLSMKGRDISEHIAYRKEHSVKCDYRKGQLDPVPSKCSSNSEHSYAST